MTMALEGIRVVELAVFAAGPYQGTILGDYGAEVIKIERPGFGSPLRHMDQLRGASPASDIPYSWQQIHRNKKSICINLKSEEGQKAAHRLVETADVFLSNVELVELDKFRMDYDTLSKLNPRLIYAHSSAYGHAGPDARKRGFDMGAWSRSGLMLKIAEPGGVPPLNPVGLPDIINASYTALGIILALLVRERTGIGQMVTNSIFGSMVWSCASPIEGVAVNQKDDPPRSRTKEGNPFYNRYKTKDGKWLVLLSVQSGQHWHDYCETLEIQELENDPRFDTHLHRTENNVELIAIFDRIFASEPLQHWIDAFEGKNIIWSVAQTFLETVRDPQTTANQYVANFDHPEYGALPLVRFPAKLSKTPPTVRRRAPEMGEHTDEVLTSLGYSPEEITKMKAEGAIG